MATPPTIPIGTARRGSLISLAVIAAARDEADRVVVELPGPGEGPALFREVDAQLGRADARCERHAAAEQHRNQDPAAGHAGRGAKRGEDPRAHDHRRGEEHGGQRPELPLETAALALAAHRTPKSTRPTIADAATSAGSGTLSRQRMPNAMTKIAIVGTSTRTCVAMTAAAPTMAPAAAAVAPLVKPCTAGCFR